MNILGISGGTSAGNQDGAAALLVDGALVAAAEEERFTGIKFANGLLPKQAIRYCLRQAGLKIEDLDAVAFPGATYIGIRDTLRRFFEYNFGHAPAIELVDHHLAHAACAYFASGWDEALVLTADFSGDGKSTTVSAARHGNIALLLEKRKPDSLGVFYSAVTQYLGFLKDSDEYKVMGMAAYGRPRFDLDHVLEVTSDGYRLHEEFLQGVVAGRPAPTKQERLFDAFPLPPAARLPLGLIESEHFDVAASAQQQLERAVLRLVEHYGRTQRLTRVCLAGGVALNCLMNQKIREHAAVEAVYVPPVASDAGLSLGAAYLSAHAHGNRPAPLAHAYWGPAYGDAEIQVVLDRAQAEYRSTADPAGVAAELLSQGKVIGWFQGRMEFGPRALGNRSILADPRVANMQDIINHKVKFREEFRPIAPSVLHEVGGDWFRDYRDSPYMTQTFAVTPAAKERIPAVVHADGTARLQSVHRATNPLYAELIVRFAAKSGVPLVVNTSLNAYNDPLACEPHQALRTYFATGMDALVIGNFVLQKRAVTPTGAKS